MKFKIRDRVTIKVTKDKSLIKDNTALPDELNNKAGIITSVPMSVSQTYGVEYSSSKSIGCFEFELEMATPDWKKRLGG